MKKRVIGALAGLGLVIVVVGAIVAEMWFIPEGSDQADESLPGGMGMADFVEHKSGAFLDGDAHHDAEGTVRVLERDGSFWLRFEGYEATPG
ncbi:MAG: hypothetical protein ACPHK8_01270, partial [Thermoplasmatota archaeon]